MVAGNGRKLGERHFPEMLQKMLEMDQKLNDVRRVCGRSAGCEFKSHKYLIDIDSSIRPNTEEKNE